MVNLFYLLQNKKLLSYILIGLSLFFAIPNPLSVKIINTFDPVRHAMWTVSLDAIKSTPLKGIGIKETKQLFEHKNIFINNKKQQGAYTSPHHQLLHNWLEQGLFSFLILALFLFSLIAYAYIKKKQELFVFLIGTLLFLCVESSFQRSKGVIIFALFYSILMVIKTPPQKGKIIDP